jgi:hypothetical protein
LQEAISQNDPIGIKHPLLAFCCEELSEAWGIETSIIWSLRPIEEAIAGLKKRGWFPGSEESLLRKEWNALEQFALSHNEVRKLSWHDVLNDR